MMAIILIFVQALFAQSECSHSKLLSTFGNKSLEGLQELCRGLPDIKSEKELKDVLEFFFLKSLKNDDKDRHIVTLRSNACKPTKDSKALIIAFEGTGAYEPLVPPTMSSLNHCFGSKIDPKLKNKIYSYTQEIYLKHKGKGPKWSGLQAGVMSELIVMKEAKHIDWYSFPSEEVEQLAGLDEVSNFSLGQLGDSIVDSIESNPRGIQSARRCIIDYIKEASDLKIEPKIIVLSHSSGGRSLVKFAEQMKKITSKDIDLAFSIDPVKEAHHAIEEVLPQKAGEPTRYLKWKITDGKGENYPYSAVWSRSQPSSLYKPSNVSKHINFYQKDDRLGLKMGGDAMRFAIQGSPVEGADNQYIKGLSDSGHGEITYHPDVIKKFKEEIEKLISTP